VTVNVFSPAMTVLLESLLPEVGDRRRLISQLAGLADENGERFAVADADARFNCPACNSPGYIFQIERT
jgi:hypothetical protein